MNACVCMCLILEKQVLLFTCIIFSLVTKGITTSTTDKGTYFLHVNKIYASYSSWLIIFTYDLKHMELIIEMCIKIFKFSKSFTR